MDIEISGVQPVENTENIDNNIVLSDQSGPLEKETESKHPPVATTKRPAAKRRSSVSSFQTPPAILKPTKQSSVKGKRRQVEEKIGSVRMIGLTLTGLSPEEKQIVFSSVPSIEPATHSALVLGDYDAKTTTHIVTSVNTDRLCQRTVKYLCGVLDGKWIVSFDCTKIYVNMVLGYLQSLSSDRWLPERDFLVLGDQVCGATCAPEKGLAAPNSLFSGHSFYLDPGMDARGPSRDDLLMLIRAGGGDSLSRKPSKKDSGVSNIHLISSEADKRWLLDCISEWRIKGAN